MQQSYPLIKPTTIQTVGTIMMIFALFHLLIGGAAFLFAKTFWHLESSVFLEQYMTIPSLFSDHLIILPYQVIFFIFIHLLILFGSIHFKQYKKWTIPFLTVLFSMVLINNIIQIDTNSMTHLPQSFQIKKTSVLWNALYILLLYYMNRRETKQHFD